MLLAGELHLPWSCIRWLDRSGRARADRPRVGRAKEATVPDSYGKRNRDAVKARKAAARDERRIARNQREKERAVTGPTEADEPVNPSTETRDT